QNALGTRQGVDWSQTGKLAGMGALGGAADAALGWIRLLPGGKSVIGSILKSALAGGISTLPDQKDSMHGGFLGGLMAGAAGGGLGPNIKGFDNHKAGHKTKTHPKGGRPAPRPEDPPHPAPDRGGAAG